MKKRKPAHLLLVLALLFVLAGCSGPATDDASTNEKPKELKSFALGHLNSTAHLLGFVAKEEGYFAEEGLDVNLSLFTSAAELVSALESKQIQAAFLGSIPALVNQSKGHDITVFGGAMTNGHGYVIKSKYTEGLSDWDITILKDRNVATILNSVQDLELQTLLKKAGLTYSDDPNADADVTLTYFASQTEAYNALANEEIDAASFYSPYSSIATNAGHSVVYYCSDIEEFKNQPCCRQVALTSALEEDPALYEAFERAILKAYKFSQENKEQTTADVKKYIDINIEDIEFEVYGGFSQSNPDPDKDATVSLYESIVDFGYTEAYDIEAHYNTGIYESALKSLLEENPDDSIYKTQLTRFESGK